MSVIASRFLRTTLFLVCSLTTSAAFAHAHLKQVSPGADTQVTPEVKALTLQFSEGIELNFSGVTLTGPQNAVIKTAPVKQDAKGSQQMVVPLLQPLPAGDYTVDWHVVSVDGHKTKGQYRFSVK